MQLNNKDSILNEIEVAHKLANDYLHGKILTKYLDSFADKLEYKQLDGKTIDKRQITRDTKKYFQRILNVENTYERISYDIQDDLFIEKLIQKSIVEIRVFIFFKKKWNLTSLGIYSWKKLNGDWKIIKVEINQESIN